MRTRKFAFEIYWPFSAIHLHQGRSKIGWNFLKTTLKISTNMSYNYKFLSGCFTINIKTVQNCLNEVNLTSQHSHLKVLLLSKIWSEREKFSIDANSGPLRYVLWCCGSICHQPFTFIQIYSGHTVWGHNGVCSCN